jgi:alpha-1,4-digalacturonate transport system substrate-binding protein
MPGGAGLVAVKYTKAPEEVTRLMEYLASEPVVREFSERTLFLPAHQGLAEKGLDFKTNDPNVKKSLDVFLASTRTLAPVARRLQAYRWSASAIYPAVITRLGQVVAGETSLDDAYARITAEVQQKVSEAK